MLAEPAVAAERAAQGAAEHGTAVKVDADPIAMHRHVDRTLGAKVGMRVPADVAQQARRESQPLQVGTFIGE